MPTNQATTASDAAWNPSSWKSFPAQQQPQYKDEEAYQRVLLKLQSLPPLVRCEEVSNLRQLLTEVYEGKRFLLQGGDCAERFGDCNAPMIRNKLRILLQMSLVITSVAKVPTVRVARMAGQYAKPRSSNMETIGDRQVPSFRGDSINSFEADAREHDPERLVQAYFHSAATLNYLRALVDSGFAGLQHSKHWELDYVMDEKRRAEYRNIVDKLLDSLEFMQTCGVRQDPMLNRIDFFSCHEALVLDYESALTRRNEADEFYNAGAHFVWIGNRTRQLDHAHVQFIRGIENPVGIKIGPGIEPQELVSLIRSVEPQNRAGRVTLISRFGAELVGEKLPPLIKAVVDAELRVIWVCDPMHGNTHLTPQGIKTRSFDTIMHEVAQTFTIHQNAGSRLSGVHFELTGEDVTECIGGPQNLNESDLASRYTTYCDPRLNYFQSMEISFRLAKMIRDASS